MRFAFEDHQVAVRDTVGALLEKRCDADALQQAWDGGSAESLLPLWRELASIGVQGLLAPEAAGGSGLDGLTMAVVLAECGRAAVPLPVLETAAVAAPVIAASGDPSGILPAILDGSAIVTVASGASRYAPSSSIADFFLVPEDGGSVLLAREEVELEPAESVDRLRDLAAVTPVAPGLRVADTGVVESACALASSAVLLGLGRHLIAATVEYVKERKQFGVPVGSFQAVKHQLADAHMRMEFAAPVVWAASHECYPGGAAGGPARMVSMAKSMASDAVSFAARVALQCHGAMGYTDDYPLHMWLKRVWCLAAAHGSADAHRSAVAKELGI